MLRPALLSLALLVPFAAQARNDAAIYDAELVSITYGAFCQQDSVGEVPAPDTAAEKIDLLPGAPEIRWPTHRIPAAPGISFGIRTKTAGDVVYSPVMIEVTHPPFPGSGTTRQSYVTQLGGEGASINAYSFDLPEEMVTGTWTFRAWHNGETLYEVRFEVVTPEAVPEIGADCGMEFISRNDAAPEPRVF